MPLAVGALSLMLKKKKHTHICNSLLAIVSSLSLAVLYLFLLKKKQSPLNMICALAENFQVYNPPKRKRFFFKCAFIPIRMLSMLREITGRIFHSHSLRSFLFNREEKSVAAYAATS